MDLEGFSHYFCFILFSKPFLLDASPKVLGWLGKLTCERLPLVFEEGSFTLSDPGLLFARLAETPKYKDYGGALS